MDIRFCIGFALIISWIYLSIAIVSQQHAKIVYYDKKYLSNVTAFTFRRGRGEHYITNCTVTTLTELGTGLSIKVASDIETVGPFVFFDTNVCDIIVTPWFKEFRKMYVNITDCPIPAATYRAYNVELPPKNFPIPLPKGHGTLYLYVYWTSNKKKLFHIEVKIVST